MSKAVEGKVIDLKSGDLVLIDNSLPNIDNILYSYENKLTFSRQCLIEYLDFLESLILHERLVSAIPRYVHGLQPDDRKSPAYEKLADLHLDLYGLSIESKINLEEEIFSNLEKKGIVLVGAINERDFSQWDIFQRYVDVPTVSKNILENEEFARSFDSDEDRCHRLGLASTAAFLMFPLFLREVASKKCVPVRLTAQDVANLSEITSIEESIQKGVITYLKDRLDAGARREILRVEKLGYATVFPETPIASQILHSSDSIEDFLPVAMTLRREYHSFRRAMLKLEEQLFDPGLTLRKRLEVSKEVEELADEIWPLSEGGFQQITSEISGVPSALFDLGKDIVSHDIPSTVRDICKLPWNIMRKYIAKRKISAVMKSKNDFLDSKLDISQIAKVLGCSSHIIEREFKDLK